MLSWGRVCGLLNQEKGRKQSGGCWDRQAICNETWTQMVAPEIQKLGKEQSTGF